jgi:hypothetical protein
VLGDRWGIRQRAAGGDGEHRDVADGLREAAEAAGGEVADRVDDALVRALAGVAEQGDGGGEAGLEPPRAGAGRLGGPGRDRGAHAAGVGAELDARAGGVAGDEADAAAGRQGLEDRGGGVVGGGAQAAAACLEGQAEGGVEQEHGVVRLAEHGDAGVAGGDRARQRDDDQREQGEAHEQQQAVAQAAALGQDLVAGAEEPQAGEPHRPRGVAAAQVGEQREAQAEQAEQHERGEQAHAARSAGRSSRMAVLSDMCFGTVTGLVRRGGGGRTGGRAGRGGRTGAARR